VGSHPINLAVRFLLELSALAALAYWGWTQHAGPLRFILAIGLPLIAAVLWGTFNVRQDPSRSGRAPVPVPGLVRLALELAFFGVAAWALYAAGKAQLSLIFGLIVVVHYLVSYDRLRWLIGQ
jgi:hypothetical protein